MYLEGIFIGGDMRAQLPDEAAKFDVIDNHFKNVSINIFISVLKEKRKRRDVAQMHTFKRSNTIMEFNYKDKLMLLFHFVNVVFPLSFLQLLH